MNALLAVLAAVTLGAEPPGPVVRAADAPRYPIAGGKGAATLFWNAGNGSPAVALSTLELKPGAVVPEHVHETSGEWLSVTRGVVELTTGGKTVRVTAGDAIFIPMGQKHAARVPADAKEAVVAVQVYAPAGPEQRFVSASAADAGVR